MATTPAAGAHAARRRWIWIAAAVAVLVLGFVLHSAFSGAKTTEQQIGEQVFGDHCLTKVSTNAGVVRRWPEAAKAEIIVCQTSENDEFANHVMDYAQFASPSALSATLTTTPPGRRYCTIGSAVVTLDDLPGSFAAMCADRGGTLHAAG